MFVSRSRVSVSHQKGSVAAADGRVVVYWRPGCMFCALLTARLGPRASRAVWVNIWKDPEAAAFVRSVNDGNETVPTVVVGGSPLTNPSPGLVFGALA